MIREGDIMSFLPHRNLHKVYRVFYVTLTSLNNHRVLYLMYICINFLNNK